jgi:hypothetical protein
MNETRSPEYNSFPIINCELFGEKFTAVLRQTSPGYLANTILGIIVNMILNFLTIVLNSITILTIWRSKKLRGTVCFFLIMLQSVADLFVGLLAIPVTTYVYMTAISSAPSGCLVIAIQMKSTYVTIGISTMMYLAITYER